MIFDAFPLRNQRCKTTKRDPNEWTLQTLTQALGDLVVEVRGNTGASLMPVVTDTRKLVAGSVFVALKGETFDGHDFVSQAAQKGAGVAIVSRLTSAKCPQIVVTDTNEALGALAQAWRRQFPIPVICVVGSNGKTTTTQMIATILRQYLGAEHVLATQGNFNNDVGVPLTLLGLHSGIKAAVVEAGMSHPGEMARLASWIKPTVTVVTNAQREHQEFLKTVEASARENAYAIVSLSGKGTAVLPAADACFPIWKNFARARGCCVKTYAQGIEVEADVTAVNEGEKIAIALEDQVIDTQLNLFGLHAVHDAAAAAAATLAIGVRPDAVAAGLAAFEPVAGRGVRMKLKSGAVVIDDAYNANPDSMKAAIDVLAEMPAPRILIAADMGEVGDKSAQYHAEIGTYAKSRGIDRFFATGSEMVHAVKAFGAGGRHYATAEELSQAALSAAVCPATLVVKASHSQRLDKIVKILVERIGLNKN